MNQTRLAVAIVLVLLMVAGWASALGGQISEASKVSQTLEKAQAEESQRLYAKAILSYEEVLAEKESKARYQDLDRVYALYYAESPTNQVRRAYTDLLSRACRAYPKETDFWAHRAQLSLDRHDYAEAVRILQQAEDKGAANEEMKAQLQEAYYLLDEGYQAYTDILPGCWQGNYVVRADGEHWGMVTADGSDLLSAVYPMMGPIGLSGQVAVTDADGESWLIDANGMLQVHYSEKLAEAGCWSEGMLPAKAAGSDTWSYFTDDGAEVLTGYLSAGSFYDGKAAVETADGWRIIDTDGKAVEDETWEAILLDENGAYEQDGCIMAQSGGQWRLYSGSWKERKNFSCDEIGVHKDGLIAFRRGGLWGFVTEKGEETIAPAYQEARSFSGGVAAVRENGKWGFLTEDGTLVVDYQYSDVGCFDPSSGTCAVQRESDDWAVAGWVVTH